MNFNWFISLNKTTFFSVIRDLVRSRKDGAWIGVTDGGNEGDYRFSTNMKKFNAKHRGNLFRWHADEPSGNQDCVWVTYGDWDLLDDIDCEANLFGLCELKTVDCNANVPYPVED